MHGSNDISPLFERCLPEVRIPAHLLRDADSDGRGWWSVSDAQQPSTCWARAMEKNTTGNKSVAGRCLGETPEKLPDWLQCCSDWRAGEGTKQEKTMVSCQLSSEYLATGTTHKPKQE